ncbi:hypothetical protein [Flagellimonas sp. S3867]|uniref:hypothetical protein n=1 Tax=Flagellimonas sp. S3867 TaxID=2768063 RepID=UPI0016891710|nr:hypothetical protein [Flagellimonas sp. S3867]
MKYPSNNFILFTSFLLAGTTFLLGQSFSGPGFHVGCTPHAFTGAPLLSGFKFDFNHSDHHLLYMGISPMYEHVNYSVAGDTRNNVCAKYSDNFVTDNDDFTFMADYYEESRQGVIVQHVEGDSDGGACSFNLNGPSNDHTFVLIGFEFHFTESLGSILSYWRPAYKDHHLGTVSIQPDRAQNELTVRYTDKNVDDPYHFDIWYAWVPNEYIETMATVSDQRVKGNSQRAIDSQGVVVLRGFTLTFGTLENPGGKDHHIDEVGVMANHTFEPNENPSNITAFFNDKNDDDKFDWSVDYAIIDENTVPSFPWTIAPIDDIAVEALNINSTLPLDDLLSDDFNINIGMDEVIGKIDFIRSIKKKDLKLSLNKSDRTNTSIVRKTAYINGVGTIEEIVEGKRTINKINCLRIYELQQNQWKLASIRITRI